jgi:hypothetical protein
VSIDSLHTRPPRLVLVNLDAGTELTAWANPPHLAMERTAHWNRIAIPGLGHQPLQYVGSANRLLSDVELAFDRRWQPSVNLVEVRAFLDGLVVPTRLDLPSAPPRVLLAWPHLLSLEVVVDTVRFEIDQLAAAGGALALRALVTFEEIGEGGDR